MNVFLSFSLLFAEFIYACSLWIKMNFPILATRKHASYFNSATPSYWFLPCVTILPKHDASECDKHMIFISKCAEQNCFQLLWFRCLELSVVCYDFMSLWWGTTLWWKHALFCYSAHFIARQCRGQQQQSTLPKCRPMGAVMCCLVPKQMAGAPGELQDHGFVTSLLSWQTCS